jgi:uncharacterized protein
MKVLSKHDYREMAWKNGKGRTIELLRLPHPKIADLFSLRLSIASMAESGPFSHYPGIERTIILLEGNGVVMDFVDEIKMSLNVLHKPIQFPGEAEITAQLINGPIREFNIMAARDVVEAYVEVPTKVTSLPVGGEEQQFCYICEGNASSGIQSLKKDDLVMSSPGEKITLTSKDGFTAIVIKLRDIQSAKK